MKEFIVGGAVKNDIAEKLKDDFFAKQSPQAYETAINILTKIQTRHELNPYINYYMNKDLHTRNLLVIIHRKLLRLEPVELEIDEVVDIPSNVYKEGKESAKVIAINKEEYMVQVRPLRELAEVLWVSTDACKKRSANE